MRYLTLGEVVELHRRLLEATGGAAGIRDFGALESATAQPKATFGSVDLYPALAEKAAALGFSLVQGHAFVDGNKRVGPINRHAFSYRFMSSALGDATDTASSLGALSSRDADPRHAEGSRREASRIIR